MREIIPRRALISIDVRYCFVNGNHLNLCSSVDANMSKRKQKDSSDSVNKELVEMLLELSEYEKNVTKQRFKAAAYKKAASAIAKHPTPIASGDEAKKLDGVGAKIAEKIDEFLATGKLQKLEKIRASDENVAIQQLTKVMGIGPAHARKLYDDGVTSVEDLHKRAKQLKLSHHQQLGLKYYEDLLERIPRAEMELMENFILDTVEDLDSEYKAVICGSYRRGAKSSGDIDILLTHPSYTSEDEKNPDLLTKIVEALSKSNFVTDSISHGDTKFMGICRINDKVLDAVKSHHSTKSATSSKEEQASSSTSSDSNGYRYRRIDIRIIPHDQYWCGVLYFTGSDGFNVKMRKEAIAKGFMLNEYSVRKSDKAGHLGDPLPVSSEEDIFRHLKMKFVQPKDRND